MKTTKTNAMRLLDQAKVPYNIKTFTYAEDDFDGNHVADVIGLPQNQVYKTLIVQGEKHGPAVFCIPVNEVLDLKEAAALLKEKKVTLYPVGGLLTLTGYVRGGCSPVGMKKHFPTFFHQDCLHHSIIAVSGGARGVQILLAPKDLMAITRGRVMTGA